VITLNLIINKNVIKVELTNRNGVTHF